MCEQIYVPEAIVCVIASQIANLGESLIGASFQDKEGFKWVSHHLLLKSPTNCNLVSCSCYSFFYIRCTLCIFHCEMSFVSIHLCTCMCISVSGFNVLTGVHFSPYVSA